MKTKFFSLYVVLTVFLSQVAYTEENPFEGFDFGGSNRRVASGSASDLLPMHPKGAVGLFRTFSALQQPGSPTSFGLSFQANYYQLKSFPVDPLITERFDGGFFFNYSPIDYLELFGGISVVTSNNEPPDNPIIRQIPNYDFGAKLTLPVLEGLHAGIVYHGQSRNSISAVTDSASALNHNIMGVVTYDKTQSFPMRFHLNVGYQVNNNLRVSQNGADSRIIAITNAYSDSAILAALGLEYLMDWALLSLEYSVDMIAGGAFGSHPQRISLGARFYPTPDQALGLTVGSDISLANADGTQAGVFVEPKYSFYFGFHYLFGMGQGPRERPIRSKSDFSKLDAKPLKKEGTINGYVNDIETGMPLSGVTILPCTTSQSPVVTDQSGRFRVEKLTEGACALTLEHPQYQTLQDQVTVVAGAESPFDFGLLKRTEVGTSVSEKIKGTKTKLTISVKDGAGSPVSAEILFANDRSKAPLLIDNDGRAEFEIEPGQYEFFARAQGNESSTQYVLLKDGEEKYLEFALSQKQKVQISKDKKKIEISETVQFEVGKALLTFGSKKLIEEIGHLLKSHPEIELIEIAGHTDSIGDATYNLKLSQSRADAVRDVLVENGIEGTRMRSIGYGEDFPVDTNDTEEGRYQNRRVEFRILRRVDN